MAAKRPNPADKGRCARCALAYFDHSIGRNGMRRCYKYERPCVRVAWNCTAPPSGWQKSQIEPRVIDEIARLSQESKPND